MTGYARAGFRVRAFGLEHLRCEPGTIVAASHRSDDDVPLLSSVLYPHWSAGVDQGLDRPTFAPTPDLFLRGFLAGYPSKLPLAVRRLLRRAVCGAALFWAGELLCIWAARRDGGSCAPAARATGESGAGRPAGC